MNNRKGASLIELMIVFVIVFVIVIIIQGVDGSGNQIDVNDFNRLMTQEGIRQPVMGGYRFGACSEDDINNVTFTGTKNDVPVNGVICKGWTKGFTIRYF